MPSPTTAPQLPSDDEGQYLRECVRIESSTLEEEFIRLPGDLAYWNHQYSRAYQTYLMAKNDLERVAASCSIIIRTQLGIENKGKVTISEVEQQLVMSADYQRAKGAEIVAEAEKVRLYGVLDALLSKRDMLISLGAHMRQEMQNDPTIKRGLAVESEVRRARRDGL